MIEKHLPFSGANNAILYFRHALALDEHRVKFRPFFRLGGKPKHERTHIEVFECSEDGSEDSLDMIKRRQSSGVVHDLELRVNSENGPETDVKEVFFAGTHCGMFPFHRAESRLLSLGLHDSKKLVRALERNSSEEGQSP